MKNITEIRKITNEAKARREAEKKQRIIAFIENKIEPMILESTHEGECSVEYPTKDIHVMLLDNVIEILKEEGYAVRQGLVSIIIEW